MTTHFFQFGFPDAEHYRHPSWLLTLTFFTNQVQPQLDLLRCGHELRPAGVHGWLQVAAIETAVSKQTFSFPNGQFQHHHSSVVLVLYLLPKELAEKVTEVHLRALGAALNVLTQEQATSCR